MRQSAGRPSAVEEDGVSWMDLNARLRPVDHASSAKRGVCIECLGVGRDQPCGGSRVRHTRNATTQALTRGWLSTNTAAIAGLGDTRRPRYDEIRGLAREPEVEPIELRTEEQVDTIDEDHKKLRAVERHVLSTEVGAFPLEPKLNRWERGTIDHELMNETMVGWYRNPSNTGVHSLSVP